MGDTAIRLKRMAGPAGMVVSILMATAALVQSIRLAPAEASSPSPERIARLETENRLFKDWLEKIEKKLDRVIERKEKQ